ncbi:primosomal protein DnaI [Paucilactobacillus wasatchensis]|uniref:Helicase loader n=1 Tax=Paucilactobacillus wasatchensis TaxID=1335616 RepID=A0A0D0YY25_9LACO|nr:primosomal protein DnaI [Paucilactobacillus wasatchensis]KIS04079.1 Helicase loader [Paucilactobacillus wasatchensis]
MESVSESIKKMMKSRNFDPEYQKLIEHVYADKDVQSFLQVNQDKLSENSIMRGEAKLYEFVNEKTKLARNEATFAPGYRPTLVLNKNLIDVSYVPTNELLAQQAQTALKHRVRSISMPKLIKSASFDQFDMDNASRNQALMQANEFVASYRQHKDQFQPGLYLYGSFGVGKTYLLGAIANELAKYNVTTTMIHFPSFAVEMKNAIGDNNTGNKIESIKKSPILMLDDIGADAMSAWIRDDVLGVILEYRMQAELPTFFSSNFSMTDFESEHLAVNQRGDVEPLKAKRIMERIRFLAREVTMTGDNRRPKA